MRAFEFALLAFDYSEILLFPALIRSCLPVMHAYYRLAVVRVHEISEQTPSSAIDSSTIYAASTVAASESRSTSFKRVRRPAAGNSQATAAKIGGRNVLGGIVPAGQPALVDVFME